ncbi:MAG: acyl-CoA thioesterase [Rhizobium sp.]|nr:MAG: acyl-CoA thioesterase [Rhizobium sp.]
MSDDIPSSGKPAERPAPSALIDIVFPGDTNHHGTLFGGAGLALMDRVAFIAASRFGRVPFVTASCERVDFKKPARIGEIVEVMARPISAGRRSLTVEVGMTAETVIGAERHLCTRGIFHMVAVPGGDRPTDWSLPPLQNGIEDDSREEVRMVDIVFADQSNSAGKMFGGEALAFMTKAAFVAGSRCSGALSVLASSERIDFQRPVAVGEIVEAVAKVVRIGRASMAVETELWAEDPLSGRRHLTARGTFNMVAVDANHRPVPVIPRIPGTA